LPAGTKTLDKEYSTGTGTTAMNSGMVGNTGNSAPVYIMQPYLTLKYVICVQGYYPSRN
jgi:microcystin-dependent protein